MDETESEEKSEKNCLEKLEKNNEKHNHKEFPELQLPDLVEEDLRWRSVTHDSYPAPQPDSSKSIGRRRELVQNFIGQKIFEETINAMVSNPLPECINPSEYVDNFCDSEFIPFMNRTEYDTRKHEKYPLYGGATVQSYFKHQLDKGSMKIRSEISDFNQPFRRSSAFTTPPDLALKEPTGGF